MSSLSDDTEELNAYIAKLPDRDRTKYGERLETAHHGDDIHALVGDLFSERDVFVEGLHKRPELNSRRAVVIGNLRNGRIPVRILLPKVQYKCVRIKLRNLRPADEEPKFNMIWALNEQSNTGLNGGLGEIIAEAFQSEGEPEASLMSVPYKMSDLHRECEQFGWIRHKTTLCEAFGLHILCFARPYIRELEHQGFNNVIGTYFICERDTGLAANTILGRAGFVRLSPSTGEPVDFTHREARRAMMFINDLMESFGDMETFPMPDEFYEAMAECYPYYDIVGGCTMRMTGFDGTSRSMFRRPDGTYEKTPEDMQPVPGHFV